MEEYIGEDRDNKLRLRVVSGIVPCWFYYANPRVQYPNGAPWRPIRTTNREQIHNSSQHILSLSGRG